MHAHAERHTTMTRVLDVTTLSIGVCLVTFLYLPSVVRSDPLPAAIAASPDEG